MRLVRRTSGGFGKGDRVQHTYDGKTGTVHAIWGGGEDTIEVLWDDGVYGCYDPPHLRTEPASPSGERTGGVILALPLLFRTANSCGGSSGRCQQSACGEAAMAERPNPGSNEARTAGCICAVLDNNHGRYAPSPPDGWWLTEGCPVHSALLPVAQPDGEAE